MSGITGPVGGSGELGGAMDEVETILRSEILSLDQKIQNLRIMIAGAEERGRQKIRERILAILDLLPGGIVASSIRTVIGHENLDELRAAGQFIAEEKSETKLAELEEELKITKVVLKTCAREEKTNRDDLAASRKKCEEMRKERDRLHTALTEVNDLLLSVPPGEDWRAVVRKKVIITLYGEPAWKET